MGVQAGLGSGKAAWLTNLGDWSSAKLFAQWHATGERVWAQVAMGIRFAIVSIAAGYCTGAHSGFCSFVGSLVPGSGHPLGNCLVISVVVRGIGGWPITH